MVTTNRKNWVRRWFSNQLQGLTTKRRKTSSLTIAEALEDRTLLTAYVVDTLDDLIPVNPNGDVDGFISLREAIEAANGNSGFGDAPAGDGSGALDTITFAPGLTGTITLDNEGLTIRDDLNIFGDGRITIDAGGNSLIINVDGISPPNGSLEAELHGLNLINGSTTGLGGAGIFNNGSTVHVSGVTFAGNHASQRGGSIYNNGGTFTLTNSTVSGNTANDNGGAIANFNSGIMTIVNSTITGNRSDNDNSGLGIGGGIHSHNSATTTINNTIVAGNFKGTGAVANDISNTLSGAYNLIGDAGTSGGLTDGTDGNIVGNSGTGTIDINTVLNTTLQNLDGAMMHQIIPSGPATDNGSNALSVDETNTRLQFDQRGGPFARVMAGTVDIGAYEFVNLGVNTLEDETTNADTLSLREALAIANSTGGFDQISLPSTGTINLTQGQLEITDDLLLIGPGADQLTIDAQGNSRVFSISGGADVEIVGMTLTGGGSVSEGGGIWNNGGTLTVRNSSITNNAANSSGGGIAYNSNGTLHVIDSSIRNNTATNFNGGGIVLQFGSNATISGSTISGNHAELTGGGIAAYNSTLTIANSTVSGNTANDAGGGMNGYNSTVTIVNSTVTLNRTDSDGNGSDYGNGGGINIENGTAPTLHNTIVAGNLFGSGTTPSDIDGDVAFTVTGSNNLIGDADSAGGLTDGTNGNIVGVGGTGVRDIATILDTTLQDNGGPTPTHGLLAGSEALNNGADNRATEDGEIGSTALAGDQRGANRFDGTVDIGAVEGIGDDHGNDANSATPLNNSVVETGDIESNGDRDWFSFDVVDGITYSFATFDNAVDTELRLYAADGTTELQYDDDGGGPGNASLINWTATFTGTAYLAVEEFGDNNTGAYNIVAYDDHGGNSDIATPLALSTPTAGDIEVTGDQDWFVLPVVSGLEYTFTATQSDLDGALYLYESDGTTLITSADAFGQSEPDIITWTATFTGDAYLKMERYDNDGTGTYELTAIVTSADDHANSSTGATVLTPSTPVAGDIEYNGDQDWFSINVISGREYNFETINTSIDTILRLYDADGITELDINDDGGLGAASKITWTATFTGTAYLSVRHYNDSGTGTYELTAEVTSPPVDNVAGWNATTGRWYFGENVDGTIDQQTGTLWGPGAGWDIHQGDFNGDGVEDIAGRTDTGQWHVIDGATKTSSYWGAWGTDASHRWNDESVQGIVDVGDFNGDGLDDILGKNWRGEFYVSFSQGGSFSGATYMGRVAQLGWVAHRLGDFDGDGDTDVYSFRENGQRWINESDGTSFTLDFHGAITNQATAQWDHFLVGDFNGDGADDIIQQAIGANGQWWKATSNGLEDGHFVTEFVNRWDASAFIDFQIGDFDGDGRDDLIGQTNTNQFWINRSLPNGRMNLEFFNAWSAAATFDAVVGDFNGDGMDDVAGVRHADGAWFVHQSTGAGTRAIGSVFGSWSNFTGNNEIFTAFNGEDDDFLV